MQVLKLAELVVAANVSVVGRQSHEEVHEADDDHEAGDRREDEHHCGRLDVVLAEHLHLGSPHYLHVNPLRAWKKSLDILLLPNTETSFS